MPRMYQVIKCAMGYDYWIVVTPPGVLPDQDPGTEAVYYRYTAHKVSAQAGGKLHQISRVDANRGMKNTRDDMPPLEFSRAPFSTLALVLAYITQKRKGHAARGAPAKSETLPPARPALGIEFGH